MMTALAAGIRDQFQDERLGSARRGSRHFCRGRIEPDDPRVDVGGLQRGDEEFRRIRAILTLHDQPNGGSGGNDAKRQRRTGDRDREQAGTVESSPQHQLERRAGDLAFSKQDHLWSLYVLSRDLSGNAAQDFVGTAIADGNGGPQGERRQPAPARQLRRRRNERGIRSGQDRDHHLCGGACRSRGDPMW